MNGIMAVLVFLIISIIFYLIIGHLEKGEIIIDQQYEGRRIKSKHQKVAWYCENCLWLTVSDSKVRHCMDSCLCGETAMDLEEHYCRCQGKPIVIARLKDGDTKWRYVRK